MEEPTAFARLTRAWVLVSATNEKATGATARCILALNNSLEWPDSHIVRADVVDGIGEVNIVVPVWTRSSDDMKTVVGMIEDVKGVEKAQAAMVKVGKDRPLHDPFPPHNAKGYVTQEEVNPVEAGILGFNGWG
jgi:hypothetical protein